MIWDTRRLRSFDVSWKTAASGTASETPQNWRILFTQLLLGLRASGAAPSEACAACAAGAAGAAGSVATAVLTAAASDEAPSPTDAFAFCDMEWRFSVLPFLLTGATFSWSHALPDPTRDTRCLTRPGLERRAPSAGESLRDLCDPDAGDVDGRTRGAEEEEEEAAEAEAEELEKEEALEKELRAFEADPAEADGVDLFAPARSACHAARRSRMVRRVADVGVAMAASELRVPPPQLFASAASVIKRLFNLLINGSMAI